MHAQPKLAAAATAVDHLILGAADLDRGIEWLERLTGVRAIVGGIHPGRGTRNALLSLGRRQYLEILAPDPSQAAESVPPNLRALNQPRLIGWAAAATDIDVVARSARDAGHQVVGPRPGSRTRPDGRILKWTTLGVASTFAEGEVDPVPFFIQWSADSLHPSQDSPKGCQLVRFELAHPRSEALRTTLKQLGIDSNVARHGSASLATTVEAPKGSVRLT